MQKQKREPIVLKAKNLIEKRNLLNEMKTKHMTLQEVRFFTIYLSKINPRDNNSRYVRFPLDDFRNIMELGRLTIPYLQDTTDRLLSKIVNVRTENGGYTGFQIFSRCKVDKDENGEWFIEINAHDDALPLMFDFKKEYFTYELWNALKLSSPNQIRMYELLKQYEKKGERTISLSDLKDFLGIQEDQYPRFGDFKIWVLNKAQEALKENTDIWFEYKLIKKGAKVTAIQFLIFKNDDYTDQICLAEFIEMKKQIQEENEAAPEAAEESREDEILRAYQEITALSKNNLSDDEIMNLNQAAFEYLLEAQRIGESPLLEQAEYVKKQALYVNAKNPSNYYPYLIAAIEKNYAGA
jgi:plasmid replication initiation protein